MPMPPNHVKRFEEWFDELDESGDNPEKSEVVQFAKTAMLNDLVEHIERQREEVQTLSLIVSEQRKFTDRLAEHIERLEKSLDGKQFFVPSGIYKTDGKNIEPVDLAK